MRSLWFFAAYFQAFSDVAHAHWGHVGEVAGHGHLIAAGAVLVAGALAGLVGKLKDDEALQTDAEPESGELEGEPT